MEDESNSKNEKLQRTTEKRLFRNKSIFKSELVDTDVLIHNLRTIEELEKKAAKRKRELVKGGKELIFRTTILENASDPILLRDSDNDILFVNKTASEMYGYGKDELIGMNMQSLIFPDEIPNLQKMTKSILKKKDTQWETHTLHKDNSISPVEIHSHLIKIGTRNYILSVIRDITERKRSEETIREYLSMLEMAQILVMNTKNEIVFWSRGAEKLYGFSNKEAIGKIAHKLLQTAFPKSLDELISELYKNGKWEGELTHTKRDGTIIQVISRWALYRNQKNEPATIIEVNIDITEQKKMESRLREYAKRITEVEEAEMKRLAYELHDDTAQSLAIVKLQLDALVESGKISSKEVIDKLQYLRDDTDRAIQNVRRFSHELRPAVLDNLGLVAALEQLVEDNIRLWHVKIDLNVEGEEKRLPDEVRLALFRICQEALNNAHKHSQATQVTVQLVLQEHAVKLIITDNGKGFDVKQGMAKATEGGSLGLLSMQERAEMIGAEIKIDSKIGNGTQIIVDAKL
jgi:PAS domain S-box-containing protein